MPSPTASEIVVALRDQPDFEPLSALVWKLGHAAATTRRPDFASPSHAPGPEALATIAAAELKPEQVETPFGNALAPLEHGVQNEGDRALVSALLALGAARALSAGEAAVEPAETAEGTAEPPLELTRDRVAGALSWLSAHTPVDALVAVDAAFGDDAAALWESFAKIAREPTTGAVDFGRAEALAAAAGVAASDSEVAHRARLHLSQSASDPAVRALATGAVSARAGRLEGELGPTPFGPLATAILTFTLLLFVVQLWRALLRFVLAFRRPASLSLGPNGLELSQRTELLGKVLRDRNIVVPLGSLVRVTREVRYARAGLYAGLTALVLGSYFGMGLLVDAVRVPGGSASLLGMAILLMVVGLGLDFFFSTAADSSRGRCRVLVVPQRGRSFCLTALDPARADAMLASISEQTRP